MPDKFECPLAMKNENITVVCGDSFSRIYNIPNALEVVFQSPAFNYQITLENNGDDWKLIITPYQTQVIEEGSYKFQLRAKYENEVVKTFEEGVITFLPSVFPAYKTYPIVLREDNPAPEDNSYGVSTIWYNKINQTMWVLESCINDVAVWKKTSNFTYIYQTEITSDFKLSGNTTVFTLLQVTEGKNINPIIGVYDEVTDKTLYNINLTNIETAEYYIYADKSLEDRPFLETFDQEIDPKLIIYKYTYIKDSQQDVKVLKFDVENIKEDLDKAKVTISPEQEAYIRDMVNQMIADAKFEIEGD